MCNVDVVMLCFCRLPLSPFHMMLKKKMSKILHLEPLYDFNSFEDSCISLAICYDCRQLSEF
ncbi:hypothetical protein H5410_031371 [Solanum commersonii]|uniref:Uncharacterized protein n=1 Tax=Solanum commersonii TaxID=4109 RepID=A0A9J5YI76_SOLCO|nr:hypothetical protein H5410_031371 [Solanum commersonii]